MTLRTLLKDYDCSAPITIPGYLNRARYDYILEPPKYEEDFTGNNPNGYIPACLERETELWDKIKKKTVLSWNVGMNSKGPELIITLEE